MKEKHTWIYDILFIAVLLAAAFFRFTGLNWDEIQHLHPDERFMTMVESALEPVQSIGQYFDTANSTLNPHNRGYGFYVYGDLPLIAVRYLAQWVGETGYDQVNILGRQVSAASDLLVIFLLYLIVSKLYGRRIGVLASAFSAVAVMQIQQSHFFTTDNPANFFAYLVTLFAVLIAESKDKPVERGDQAVESIEQKSEAETESISEPEPINATILFDSLLWLSILFGLTFGMALASKLSAAPMALLLPAAFGIRYLRHRQQKLPFTLSWERIIVYLVAGGAVAVLAFRIFQPYAFLGLGINPAWLQNIKDLQAQSSGDADVPFALQWARRSHLYSGTNLALYGLGIPLALLALAGFLWMGWRIVRGEWKHAMLWAWTAIFFISQSLAFNPTMRYQLPIYPLLAMMAAWAVFEIPRTFESRNAYRLIRNVSYAVGGIVLVLTAAWAFAFLQIYERPHTRVAATRWIYQNLPGPITLSVATTDGEVSVPLPFPYDGTIQNGTPYLTPFTANVSGNLTDIVLPHVLAVGDSNQTLSLVVAQQPDTPPEQALATSTLVFNFVPAADGRGQAYTLKLDRPVALTKGESYFLRFETTGALTLKGAAPINESSWDDGLPLRMDGYDAFGGLYDGTLNLEMYWDDNADKVTRFVTTLTQGDYIFVTSNRQWATTTRVPERYPLTSVYYRLLLGCPTGKDIIWCYNTATPGQFNGQLGYKLVKVFESFPTLEIPGVFKWQLNDQFAEEAFTVYDHPKVLIFQKTADFSAAKVQTLLGAVDLSHVVHLTPKAAGSYQFKGLMLPSAQSAQQRAGGTWSQLFSYDWIQNRYPYLGLVFWYLFIFLLGVVTYPLARLALPGLGVGAYALGRISGIVLLGYLSWLAGSVGLTYSRTTIGLALALITVAGLGVGWLRRKELLAEWKANWRFFLTVELVFLGFFLFDLFVRLGNPDLWHPAKGGERPMDFSYFNAVLKSTSFPAYDPWFAGGYINYYYYGFVLVGTPVKLLGIVPSIAYNLILPTLFGMVALGAFTVGYQLLKGTTRRETLPAGERSVDLPVVTGISAAIMTVAIGNLGTVRMLYQAFQHIGAPGGVIDNANIFQRLVWAGQGMVGAVMGVALPIGPGEWYWDPSRIMSSTDLAITEFPLFTFIYSDMHAHMIVLPLALFVLAWAISIIKSRATMTRVEWVAALFAGGLVLGAIYPTNLSDIYTYLLLAVAVLAYVLWFHADVAKFTRFPMLSSTVKRLLLIALGVGILAGLSFVLYEPYRYWYSQAYGAVDPWTGEHTPIWSYLTHWGLFLFLIASWMLWETREWMASTPVSSLGKLRPFMLVIEGGLAVLLAALVYLALKGVSIGWLALPLAAWAGILILRRDQPDEKRLILFLTGTALLITIVVEVVVVRGDIGRMNTVFKFYLQAWVMLAVSAAAAFGWMLADVHKWLPRWRNIFLTGFYMLAAGAFLFTMTATLDKVKDRMAPNAPHTLDSMTYMQYAVYADYGHDFPLSEDYQAIRWLQDNVQGSPVIAEAASAGEQYRWHSRITIYTGLPDVVGWQWHQQQQRLQFSQQVIDRGVEVDAFFTTPDKDAALSFLRKYDVRYIIVGQLEIAKYTPVDPTIPNGLLKFAQLNGVLWKEVFRAGGTVIYEVIQ